MSDADPRSRRVVVPGVRWLRFPRRLEKEYRDFQCREAVAAFRVNAFYILLLYILLITGIYALAPEAVRGRREAGGRSSSCFSRWPSIRA